MTKLLTKLAGCSSDDLFVMWSPRGDGGGGWGRGATQGKYFRGAELNISQSVADIASFLLNFLWFVSSCLRGGAEYYEVRQSYPGHQRLNTALR